MFKAVIFDMDGLIFDTERLNVDAWQTVGQNNGLAITEKMALEVVGLAPALTKAVFETYLGELPHFYELREQRIHFVRQSIAEHGMPVKKGLTELLDFLLKNGYKLALATSTPRSLATSYLELAGILDCFDPIVCGDMIEHSKPAPDIYLKACELLHEAPENCLTLEDSPVGVKAAWLAGTRPVMIPDLIDPDESVGRMLYARVESLMDVIQLLHQATPEEDQRSTGPQC